MYDVLYHHMSPYQGSAVFFIGALVLWHISVIVVGNYFTDAGDPRIALWATASWPDYKNGTHGPVVNGYHAMYLFPNFNFILDQASKVPLLFIPPYFPEKGKETPSEYMSHLLTTTYFWVNELPKICISILYNGLPLAMAKPVKVLLLHFGEARMKDSSSVVGLCIRSLKDQYALENIRQKMIFSGFTLCVFFVGFVLKLLVVKPNHESRSLVYGTIHLIEELLVFAAGLNALYAITKLMSRSTCVELVFNGVSSLVGLLCFSLCVVNYTQYADAHSARRFPLYAILLVVGIMCSNLVTLHFPYEIGTGWRSPFQINHVTLELPDEHNDDEECEFAVMA